MSERRPIGSLDDVEAENEPESEDEEEPDEGHSQTLQRARKAQRLVGWVNWLATRSRPGTAV